MNAYMVSGRDPQEGATIVFADSVREAKRLGWKAPFVRDYVDEYVCLRVVKSEATPFLLALKKNDGPEVLSNIPCCDDCEKWDVHGLDENGFCESCAEEREFDAQ